MKYSTFMTSRYVDLQGTVHYINANIYHSMLQNSIEINKLCKSIDMSMSRKVKYTTHCNMQYPYHRLNLIPSVKIRIVLATLRQLEMSKNHKELTLMLVLANVFSSKAIRDADPQLRMAMEDVAGKAEQLAKEKVKDDPPPPFRKHKMRSVSKFLDWDPKKYATDGKASHDK